MAAAGRNVGGRRGKKSESVSACRDWQIGLSRLIAPLFLVFLEADCGCRRAPGLRVMLNKLSMGIRSVRCVGGMGFFGGLFYPS